MRAISHFILEVLNQIDFFAGGHLILKSQALTHLSYPGIFLGRKRPENDDRLVYIHSSDICKSKSSKFQHRLSNNT